MTHLISPLTPWSCFCCESNELVTERDDNSLLWSIKTLNSRNWRRQERILLMSKRHSCRGNHDSLSLECLLSLITRVSWISDQLSWSLDLYCVVWCFCWDNRSILDHQPLLIHKSSQSHYYCVILLCLNLFLGRCSWSPEMLVTPFLLSNESSSSGIRSRVRKYIKRQQSLHLLET
jgi:hypothetical protein